MRSFVFNKYTIIQRDFRKERIGITAYCDTEKEEPVTPPKEAPTYPGREQPTTIPDDPIPKIAPEGPEEKPSEIPPRPE